MDNSWIDKRNSVYKMIKNISEYYGGDNPSFLKNYCDDVIQENKNNLDVVLSTLSSMEKIIDKGI